MNRFPLFLLAPVLGLGACAGHAAGAPPAALTLARRLADAPRPEDAPLLTCPLPANVASGAAARQSGWN